MEPISETRQVLNQLIAEGDVAVAAVLVSMGRKAQQIVPKCVGLSLALHEEDLTFTLVASSEEIAALDAVQYLDGGPCVAAALHEAPVSIAVDADSADDPGDPGDPDHQLHDRADRTDRTESPDDADDMEAHWQLYARASAAAGVASSLTLPIERGGAVVGTVNLYGATPDAFEGHHETLAKALGASAGDAVSNADLSFSTRLAAAATPEKLADQMDVDVALGLIAESQQVDIPTARERLRGAAVRAGISEGQAARAVRGMLWS